LPDREDAKEFMRHLNQDGFDQLLEKHEESSQKKPDLLSEIMMQDMK
jgi:hypothetical protein